MRAAAKVKPDRRDNFKRLEFHDLRHTLVASRVVVYEVA